MAGNRMVDLFGAPFGLGSSDEDIFGRKPEFDKLKHPELKDAQTQAIAENRGALPEAQALAGSINTYNRDQLHQMLQASVPDLDAIQQKASHNILDELSGKVPSDISDLVMQKSAARGLGGGYGGSGLARNLTARDLGLTSLGLTERGLSSAESWMNTAKNVLNAPLFDVSSMFVSPAQQYASMMDKFEFDVYKENVAAAPDPAARGRFDTNMQMIGMAASFFGMKMPARNPAPEQPQQPQRSQPQYGAPQYTMGGGQEYSGNNYGGFDGPGYQGGGGGGMDGGGGMGGSMDSMGGGEAAMGFV